jgi:vancomycin resistance protein YoaR
MAIFTRAQRTIAAEFPRPLWPGLFIVPAILLALFVSTAVAMDTAFAGRAIPGLRVGGVEVGALESAEIRRRLAETVAPAVAAGSVRASLDGRTFDVTNAELGLTADLDGAVADALSFGRGGTPLARLDAWLDAVMGRARVGLTLRPENDAAQAWVAQVAAAVDRPAVDAAIERTAAGLVVTSSADGLRIDRERLLAMLLEPASAGDRAVQLPSFAIKPSVDSGSSREALQLARAVTVELEVTAGERSLIEDPIALASFVWTERVGSRYVAWIQEDRVRTWAAAVAAQMDRPARNATYRVGASGAYEVVPGHDGVVVHQEALVSAVIDALRSGGEPLRRVIVAPLTSEQPRFGTAEAERYLTQLTPIATFRTAFPVNPARYTNIRIGASQFDGRVVAPGEELSFWSVFGGDPSRMGFVPAGAIINGISDNSVVGGGLCQVSTTLFNAVANAGYEIVERHAHSYLIERYPIGLDAAVFFPGADMRWKNDTAYPVLIRSAVTPTSVSFTIVSVPTGRTVSFTGAAQSRFVPVTADLRPDPGHVAGYSVAGRDVVRVRTVMAGDTQVHRDVFFSRYAPVWGGPR